MQKLLMLLGVLAAASTFGVARAQAAPPMIFVDDNKAECPTATFTAIQPAVTAAPAGTKIVVCPGTYVEQVTIPAGKDGLTLVSRDPLAAVIKAPALMVSPKAIVRDAGSKNVSILQFTITGPGGFGCDSLEDGVRVDSNGSALIRANHITEIRDDPFGGCQNGVAIQVGRQAEGQVGSAAIIDNSIDRYQKNGITIDNAGSAAAIFSNTVRGIGPTSLIAQNGIQVSRGAVADVRQNRVFDNTYSLANVGVFSSTGILLFGAANGTRVVDNTAARNDDNLGAYMTTSASITGNRFTDSTFYDGIFMNADTAKNRIENNFLRRNTEHDCHDDSIGAGTAGTANFWISNDGVTQNRPGLCRAGNGDDDDSGQQGGRDGGQQGQDGRHGGQDD